MFLYCVHKIWRELRVAWNCAIIFGHITKSVLFAVIYDYSAHHGIVQLMGEIFSKEYLIHGFIMMMKN